MKTLLEEHPGLLGEEDACNLMDAGYCKHVLGLNIANLPLLRHRDRGHVIRGHGRYWKHVFADRFHVCSQWWKDRHRSNAGALSRFVSDLAGRNPKHPGTACLHRHMEALDRFAGTVPGLRRARARAGTDLPDHRYARAGLAES